MSSFLMGCCDDQGRWRTVCKVANGFDDATLDRLNLEMKPNMNRIDKDVSKVGLVHFGSHIRGYISRSLHGLTLLGGI